MDACALILATTKSADPERIASTDPVNSRTPRPVRRRFAAALLGARGVAACDVDPAAVEVAAANLRRTGLGVLLFTGSTDAIRSGYADLVVANISAQASIELAPELLRCLAPGGRCIASGIESPEAPAVEEAVERAGAAIERRMTKGDWHALVITRRV